MQKNLKKCGIKGEGYSLIHIAHVLEDLEGFKVVK
jgi:hypothetical protein